MTRQLYSNGCIDYFPLVSYQCHKLTIINSIIILKYLATENYKNKVNILVSSKNHCCIINRYTLGKRNTTTTENYKSAGLTSL